MTTEAQTTEVAIAAGDGGGWEGETAESSRRQTILMAVNITFGACGMLGNLLVLFVLFRFTNMRGKLTSMFIINQSVLDLLTATFLLFTTALPADGRFYVTLADDIYCRVWVGRVPLWLCLHMSTFNLVALTLERYFSVVYPILHKMSFTKNKAMIAIATIWVVGILWDFAGSIPVSAIRNGRCVLFIFPNAQVQQAVGMFGICINYFIPIFILIFCYSRMAYSLTKNIKKVAPLAETTGGASKGGASQQARGRQDDKQSLHTRGKRNIIRTLTIVSLVFVLCVSWNQWFFFLFNLGIFDYTALNGDFYFFSVVAMFANCCVNPIIYTAKYEEFQNGLKKLFCSGNGRCGSHQDPVELIIEHGTSQSTS